MGKVSSAPSTSSKSPALPVGENAPIRERALPRSPLFVSLLLFVTTVLVFSPVRWNEFVNYDDSDYVTANPHVQSGLKWSNIAWAFTTGHASNWHPITWISHMIDCQLCGQNAAAHHMMSVVFHAVNVVLLFLLLRRMTGSHWASAFVAALFAWHPLHVESVAWASERKDVLSAFFFLLTLHAYARYAESKVQSPKSKVEDQTVFRERWVYYALAVGFYALGLMSKPMLVTTPFVMLLLDYWPLRRNAKWFGLILEKAPFFALSVASSVVTFEAQRHGGAVSTSISLAARVMNAVVAYALYIRNMFFPVDLAVLYPHPESWPATYIVVSAIVLVAISAAVIFFGRRQRWLLAGWLWFLGTLVPAIGLVQVGVQCMADRYTYLPLIGLFVMVTWGVAGWAPRENDEIRMSNDERNQKEEIRKSKIENRNKTPRQETGDRSQQSGAIAQQARTILGLAGGVVLAACIAGTVHQIGYWRTSESLFNHAAHVTKNNYLAYNNLGFYLSGRGEVQGAMENYRKALEINPRYEDAYNNMGYALASLKRYPEAIAHYEAALRLRPNHAEVHNNFGNALADLGRIDEAIEHYRIVLKRNPEHADAHNNLGIALAMKGQFDEAIGHFKAAIEYKPGYASAHSNLGNALAVQHKLPEAIREYEQCLKLSPKDAQAHNNLGNVLAEQGNLDEAVKQYDEALKLNSDNPEAHFNLGMALKRQGKTADAIGHLTEALRLKPDYADAHKQLEEMAHEKVK